MAKTPVEIVQALNDRKKLAVVRSLYIPDVTYVPLMFGDQEHFAIFGSMTVTSKCDARP